MNRSGEDTGAVLEAVRKAIAAVPDLAPGAHGLDIAFDNGALTLAGEVGNIAVKKIVLERAAAVPAVSGIVDRLHTTPAQRMGDREITDHVRHALAAEPALRECAIRLHDRGELRTIRSPDSARGVIDIAVADGVVTLDGEVPSLSHKRLAGVLAWWVPGSRDVINGLGVEPPEDDNDDEVTDAVRLVLEKDPFVDASRVRVSTRDYVVTLEGLVPSDKEREMAELDAWYVFAVDQVVNHIEVRP